MGIKFQCHECHGIVATDFDDELVMCGHCGATCQVPKGFGPGVVIDDFAILQLIGQGGMGDVYLAHQFSLDREVALKILKAKFLEDPKFSEEFIQEARAVASLNHPNIIRAYKVGFDQDKLFFAMEMVEGQNLNDILKHEGALDPSRVIEIAIDAAEALGYAWDTSRLIHRDIKPDNIMISSDGVAKVMDLGLSRRAGDVYDDGDIISGTPQYISPEQIMGDAMDVRGDFYSLGATLYHLVSGRFVFDGSLEEMIKKHMTEKPPSLKQVAPHVSEAFGKIIRKLLAKKPENRYQDAASLIADLKKAQKAQMGTTTKRHITVKNISGTTTRGTSSRALKKPSKEKKTARRGKPVKEKKDPTTKIVIGIGVGALILGLILLMVFSGEDSSRKAANSSAKGSAPAKPVLTPREQMAMKHPTYKQALHTSGFNRGLRYKYYKGRFKNLEAMLKKKPEKKGEVKELSLSLRRSNQDFGLVFEGFIMVPKTEVYTFYLKTDDGSKLIIDDVVVIDNDGKHAMTEKSGEISLQKGVHKYRIEYFQERDGFGFEHKVESFSFDKIDVPKSWFRYKP
ncbi:MAG: protein kinase [Lentisphaerales bacterium]|nr:protein kinase [Lentisphaerales bacterium]